MVLSAIDGVMQVSLRELLSVFLKFLRHGPYLLPTVFGLSHNVQNVAGDHTGGTVFLQARFELVQFDIHWSSSPENTSLGGSTISIRGISFGLALYSVLSRLQSSVVRFLAPVSPPPGVVLSC